MTCLYCGEEIREDDDGNGRVLWVHDYGSTVCYDDPPGSNQADNYYLTVATPLTGVAL